MVRGDSYCCGLSHLGGWQLSSSEALTKEFFKILNNRTGFPQWTQPYFKSYFQITASTSSNLCRLAMKYGGYVIHQVFHNETGSSTVAILGRPKPSTEEHYNEGWKRKNYNPVTVEFDGDEDDETEDD